MTKLPLDGSNAIYRFDMSTNLLSGNKSCIYSFLDTSFPFIGGESESFEGHLRFTLHECRSEYR